MTMPVLSPNYLTDSDGKRMSVVLSMVEFEKILELLEDLEDVRLYDDVKSRDEESVSISDYLAQRKARVHA